MADNKIIDLERLKRNNVALRNHELYQRDSRTSIGFTRPNGVVQKVKDKYVTGAAISQGNIAAGNGCFIESKSINAIYDPYNTGSWKQVKIANVPLAFGDVIKVTIDGVSDLYACYNSGSGPVYGGCIGTLVMSDAYLDVNFDIWVSGSSIYLDIANETVSHTYKIESADGTEVYAEGTTDASEFPANNIFQQYIWDYEVTGKSIPLNVDEPIYVGFDGVLYECMIKHDDDFGWYVGNQTLCGAKFGDSSVRPIDTGEPFYILLDDADYDDDGKPISIDADMLEFDFSAIQQRHDMTIGYINKISPELIKKDLDDEDVLYWLAYTKTAVLASETASTDLFTDNDGIIFTI